MTGKPGKSLAQRTLRLGEGHAVEVSLVPATKGVQAHYAIDTSALPVPDRRLSCDTVDVLVADYMVKLLFAQKEVVGKGFLALLIVQMSFDAIHQYLKTMEPLETGIEKLENGKLPKAIVSKIDEKPQQAAVVTSSMILSGYTGTDGCLDFYYTSPFSIKSINFGNKIAVEPVVRVNLPTPLLVALWRRLKELGPDLPSLNGEVTP
jgi:hypothetical protein